MKEEIDRKWHSIKLRKQFFLIQSFLRFHCIFRGIPEDEAYDTILQYGYKRIVDDRIDIPFTMGRMERDTGNFCCTDETYYKFDSLCSILKSTHELYKAEVFEFIIYLYVKENFNETELQLVRFNPAFNVNV